MSVAAPRPILILAAVGLAGACVILQWASGFRVGNEEGRTLELLAILSYPVAIILLLAPVGRARALPAAFVATLLAAGAAYLNTKFATWLDVRFGGPYAWSGQRMLVAMLVAPVVGLFTGLVVFLLARWELIRWTGKRYTT